MAEFESSCEKCQLTCPLPSKAKLHTRQWLEPPWSHIHIDYIEPLLNKMFFVIVDTHSKWLEVLPACEQCQHSYNKRTVTECIYNLWLPNTIVSDNKSVFRSDEFTKQNGIEHIKTSPNHPATNGLAGQSVQTFFKLKQITEGQLSHIDKVLFQYRLTPQTSTGLSPAELMFGCT